MLTKAGNFVSLNLLASSENAVGRVTKRTLNYLAETDFNVLKPVEKENSKESMKYEL